MVVNPSHLPGVLILKAELHHSAPLTVACVQASSWLGSADWHDLCGKFSLFCLPSICCCVSLWGDCEKLPLWWAPLVPAWWGHFWECAETFLPSRLPPQVADPPLKFFVSFFYLYLLSYITLRRLTCLFESLGSSASIQKVVCRSCSTCRWSFDVFDLPILFLHHFESLSCISCKWCVFLFY